MPCCLVLVFFISIGYLRCSFKLTFWTFYRFSTTTTTNAFLQRFLMISEWIEFISNQADLQQRCHAAEGEVTRLRMQVNQYKSDKEASDLRVKHIRYITNNLMTWNIHFYAVSIGCSMTSLMQLNIVQKYLKKFLSPYLFFSNNVMFCRTQKSNLKILS